MQVPDEYPTLQYSACGGTCVGFCAKESKILVGKHNYLLKEIDVYPFTQKREEEWEACFRIEKHYIRVSLYTPGGSDKEVHVTISLIDDCWDVRVEEDVIICTDTSCSEDGAVFVQQRPTRKGVTYTINHDPNHTLDVACSDTVPNEPLFMLSVPSGKWVYLKLPNKLYLPASRSFVAIPFCGYLEWMDDAQGIACVETLAGFRELWRLTNRKTWQLAKRINKKLHVHGFPVRWGTYLCWCVCVTGVSVRCTRC